MNSKHLSIALGLAFAALTTTSVSAANDGAASPAGCSTDAAASDALYADASLGASGTGPDAARRSRDADPRIWRIGDNAGAAKAAPLQQLSTRVERLGQNIAAAPLVKGLMVDSSRPDAGTEPPLTTLLLAGLAVVAFVARRRRIG